MLLKPKAQFILTVTGDVGLPQGLGWVFLVWFLAVGCVIVIEFHADGSLREVNE
jgi:hypothetical protein